MEWNNEKTGFVMRMKKILGFYTKKLDAIIERQIDYVKTSARIESKQEQIEKIVTNGLSHNLADLSKKLDGFCEEVRGRLNSLEDFQWFRLPVTKLRDKIFWYALEIALVGGGIYLIIHYGPNIIKEVLS